MQAISNHEAGVDHLTPAFPFRIQVVDALRGFALFGILLVHCAEWFAAGQLPSFVYEKHTAGIGNGITQAIIGIFFSGKFYTFFSFLFGLSFALMLTRTTETNAQFYRRFAWRLFILGVIGFLHHLQWQGDILSIYAMLGFVLLLFGNAPNKFVLTIGLMLVLNLPSRISHAYTDFINPTVQNEKAQELIQQKKAEAFYKTLTKGSYADALKSNLAGFKDKMDFQFDSGRIYITLGFFLLGLYAGRRRLFQQFDQHRALFRKLTRYCGLGVIGITAMAAALVFIIGPNNRPPKSIETLFMILFDTQAAALTIFYIAGLTLLFHHRFWQWAVAPLAAVGKMALSSYVLQTLIGTLLFMGYGLGLLGQVDAWAGALIAFPIFLVQVMLSRWWLSQFRYGPLEWLWRSATYLQFQPMSR